MKKYLPFIILLVGILVLVGVYFLVIKKPVKTPVENTSSQIEVPLIDRPVASLTPSVDGHWLKLTIDKIKIAAGSMDYELLYDLPDGRTQGVPGTIKLSGLKTIERNLLMGSESSGKFRYDEGVKEGSLTLRFRNNQGKLIAKFSTKFTLASKVKELTSIDGQFTYTLPKLNNNFFVIMETFGTEKDVPAELVSGPFGIFTSSKTAIPGTVKLDSPNIYRESASDWTKLEAGKSSDVGIFVGTN